MTNKIVTLFTLFFLTQLHAVHLSENNSGQVLIFPYYTVNGGFNSLVTLTNTTDTAKALRVRFREAANSREVFAFNLYLGPNDQWIGALNKSGEDNNLTAIKTPDHSCTYPRLGNETQLFYDDYFTNDWQDNFGQNVRRMHEGFLEVIEMGQVTGNSAMHITKNIQNTQNNYYNCAAIEQAWDADDGYWSINTEIDMLPPTGGITGSLTLINVGTGVSFIQQPSALDDFADQILHYSPISESPSLAESNNTSIVNNDNSSHELQWENGIQAVTSVLMEGYLSGEYTLIDEIGADTSWVVTMPTRQYHVDSRYSGQQAFVSPFIQELNVPINDQYQACQSFYVALWDQEMQVVETPGDIVPGTPPPPQLNRIPFICYSVNNIVINDTHERSNGLLDSHFQIINYDPNYPKNEIITGISSQATQEPTFFKAGWIRLGFGFNDNTIEDTNQTYSLQGLPVIGFSLQQYINGALPEGTIANYGGIYNLKKQSFVTKIQENNKLTTPKTGLKVAEKGQVLIYPYYTVNNNIDSLMSIVNTTTETKALKVKFLEGKNNRECLSFNLYLSPFDVWNAALNATTATNAIIGDHAGEASVKLRTADHSCTVPTSITTLGQEFLPYAFDVDQGYDQLGRSLERCTEGHIEVFEMGVVIGSDAADISHGNIGIPNDCNAIQENWIPGASGSMGKWCDDECDVAGFQSPNGFGDSLENILPPTGGIEGGLSLINVAGGIDASYDAIGLKYFTILPNHSYPGSLANNLTSGSTNTTIISTKNGTVLTNWEKSIDAVSALFMQVEATNDFVINPALGAQTEWVNMYPTKQYYVDPVYSGSKTALQPFAIGLNGENGACNAHRFVAYDQEQNDNQINPPNPAPTLPPNFSFYPRDCWSVNVADVNSGKDTNTLLGSSLSINDYLYYDIYESVYDMPFYAGWMKRSYSDITQQQSVGVLQGTAENGDTHLYYGQPAIGFSIQQFVNGRLTNDQGDTVLANYASLNLNQTQNLIEIVPKQ